MRLLNCAFATHRLTFADGRDKGIIPLSTSELFNRVEQVKDPNLSYSVEVSYIEIYNEK